MLNRRSFLQRGVVTLAAGLALPSFLTRAVHAAGEGVAADPAFANRVLVVIQMAGGNDGLNMVVPFADGRYHDLRKSIGLPDDKVLPLTDGMALNPSMTKLKGLWDQNHLAVVQGVGYPKPDLSHFRSMEIWQTASTGPVTGAGWIGRYFDKVIDEQGHVLDGVAVGNSAPLSMRANQGVTAVVERMDAYTIRGDGSFPKDTAARVETLLNLYRSYPQSAPYAALLNTVPINAYRSSQELQRSAKEYIPALDYPNTPLGTGFKMLAQAMSSNLGVRVFHIGMGGFDTHTNEVASQARLLGQLSDAMSAFYQDLEAHGRAQDVLMMTWSEFGRRAQENANNGTDHGTAGPMFLLGGGLSGGLYGAAPSLTNLDNGNLKYTVDFRSVYATVLESWLGAPADEVLGDRYERLPFLASAVQGRSAAALAGVR